MNFVVSRFNPLRRHCIQLQTPFKLRQRTQLPSPSLFLLRHLLTRRQNHPHQIRQSHPQQQHRMHPKRYIQSCRIHLLLPLCHSRMNHVHRTSKSAKMVSLQGEIPRKGAASSHANPNPKRLPHPKFWRLKCYVLRTLKSVMVGSLSVGTQ